MGCVRREAAEEAASRAALRPPRVPVSPLAAAAMAVLALALGLAARAADGPTLEEAAWLERFHGDSEAAERVYREVLERGATGDARAEALFRLGALLTRRGADEEARRFLRRLFDEFPERRDLLARADAIVVRRGAGGPPDLAADAERPRGAVLALGPDRLFAFGLGALHGVDRARLCAVYRDGALAGRGIVLRVRESLAVARLGAGEARPGDEVDALARPASAAPVAAAAARGAALEADAAAAFLAEVAAELRARPDEGDVPRTATPGAVAVEVRAILCDAAFLAALPFAFERSEPAPADLDAVAPGEPAAVALLGADGERFLMERLARPTSRLASGAIPAPPTIAELAGVAQPGEPRSTRPERVDLRPAGEAAQVRFPARQLPADLRRGPVPFEGVRAALRLLDPVAAGGRPGTIHVELDAASIDRALAPLRLPGGAAAPVPPRVQRVRPVLRLTRERPVALVAGLRAPARAGTPGATAGEEGTVEVLLLVTLR